MFQQESDDQAAMRNVRLGSGFLVQLETAMKELQFTAIDRILMQLSLVAQDLAAVDTAKLPEETAQQVTVTQGLITAMTAAAKEKLEFG